MAFDLTMTASETIPVFISGTLVALLVLLKVVQNFFHQKRLSSIPHRILVNGTRGKTDVTRLIAAGLRQSGMKTMARTTGVYPTVIDFNGQSHLSSRRVPARMDELVQFVSQAHKNGAEAIVVECMALNPVLQELTQDKLIQSQIGVITNVRLDHLDVMGRDKKTIAKALSLTIPKNDILFTSENACLSVFEAVADSRNCRLVSVSSRELNFPPDFPGNPIPDNIALALAVCAHLGVSRQTALEGMGKSLPDDGAFTILSFTGLSGEFHFANAMAANDPESTQLLLQGVRKTLPEAPLYGLFCHRSDRPWRLKTFSKFISSASFTDIYFSNQFRRIDQLIDQLESLPMGSLVFAFGNYKGWGEKLIQQLDKRCCHRQ